MVIRERRESGDYSYRISVGLVHGLIIAIFTELLVVAGYMIWWAGEDREWKATQLAVQVQLAKIVTDHESRLRALEAQRR